MSITIDVVYKCGVCTQDERTVSVRERGADEPLGNWVEVMRDALNEHHKANSPKCTSHKMEYVKIPFSEAAEGVGRVVRN